MTKQSWLISIILVIAVGALIGHWASMMSLEELADAKPGVQLERTQDPSHTNQVREITGPAVEWQVAGNTYQTELAYDTPAGDEVNQLTLELDNGQVTEFELTIETRNDASIRYQENFIAELEEFILGTPVSELTGLDAVAGASVTTDAFTNALKQLPVES